MTEVDGDATDEPCCRTTRGTQTTTTATTTGGAASDRRHRGWCGWYTNARRPECPVCTGDGLLDGLLRRTGNRARCCSGQTGSDRRRLLLNELLDVRGIGGLRCILLHLLGSIRIPPRVLPVRRIPCTIERLDGSLFRCRCLARGLLRFTGLSSRVLPVCSGPLAIELLDCALVPCRVLLVRRRPRLVELRSRLDP